MSDAVETTMIAKYVLDSSSRLKTALAVYDAYDEIRRPVIKEFVSGLKEAVAGALNATAQGWAVEVRPHDDWMGQRDHELRARHEVWQPGHYVGIKATKYGPADLWFGFWKLADEAAAIRFRSDLNQRVAYDGWPAPPNTPGWRYSFEYLFDRRPELGDWRRTAAILAMHEGREGDYHQRIRDAIVVIARAADEVLRCRVTEQ